MGMRERFEGRCVGDIAYALVAPASSGYYGRLFG